MAISAIRQMFEQALDALPSPLDTSRENMDFTPVGGVAYQDVFLIPAEPENPSFSGHRERGIFQVNLMYPVGSSTALAAARAELLQTTFDRGVILTKDGVRLQMERTPEILQGYTKQDRYCVPVRIRYFANV